MRQEEIHKLKKKKHNPKLHFHLQQHVDTNNLLCLYSVGEEVCFLCIRMYTCMRTCEYLLSTVRVMG